MALAPGVKPPAQRQTVVVAPPRRRTGLWAAVAVGAVGLGLAAASKQGDLGFEALAGYLIVGGAVAFAALFVARKAPRLDPMDGLFDAPRRGQRWCAGCGRPAPRTAPCPACASPPPGQLRRQRKQAKATPRRQERKS